jgi:hypothetical protein
LRQVCLRFPFVDNPGIDPSIARVVHPVRRVEISQDQWIWIFSICDGTREASSSEDDEASFVVGVRLTNVDVGFSLLGLDVTLKGNGAGVRAGDALDAAVDDEICAFLGVFLARTDGKRLKTGKEEENMRTSGCTLGLRRVVLPGLNAPGCSLPAEGSDVSR